MNNIKQITDIFQLDFNKAEDWESTNPYGNYIYQLEFIFESNLEKIIVKQEGDMFLHPLFREYKIGRSNTWDYIYQGMFFFGLIDNINYTDTKMVSGFDIPLLNKYASFTEYLEDPKTKERIISNFKLEKLWYQKIVAGATLTYAYTNEHSFAPINAESIKHRKYLSKYKGVFETLCLIFGISDEYYSKTESIRKKITSENKDRDYHSTEKIQAVINKIDNKPELIEISENKGNLRQDKKIIELRSIFAADLDLEYTKYEAQMKVINNYAKTFDIKMQTGVAFDRAHIWSVENAVKEENFNSIADHSNGLILDPTTHRLFDRMMLVFSDDNTKLISNIKKFNVDYEFNIDHKFLTPDRIKYINKWKNEYQK